MKTRPHKAQAFSPVLVSACWLVLNVLQDDLSDHIDFFSHLSVQCAFILVITGTTLICGRSLLTVCSQTVLLLSLTCTTL